ncbi:hypothetical protein TKK_0014022 [Trichogramma kaykai]
MGLACAVVGCTNTAQNKPGFSFFRFPKVQNRVHKNYDNLRKLSLKRKETWIRCLKQGPLSEKELNYKRVCQEHFISGKPAKLEDEMHPDWAPCKNLGYTAGCALKKDAALDQSCRKETASEIIESDIVDEQIVSINEAMDLQMNEKLDDSIWNEKIDTDNDEPTINEFSTNNKFTQTDLESNEIEKLKSKLKYQAEIIEKLNLKLKNQSEVIEKLNSKIESMTFVENSFRGNDEKTLYYTGLPNAELLFLIHATVHSYLKPIRNKAALTTFQELILSLIKIRLNLPFTDLAYRFDISVSTASRIFRKTINVLAVCFSNLIVWPDRDVLLSTQPHYFSPSFKRVTVIIDCFEIYVEGSESLLANAESWSQYKHNKTIKVLVGITGQGTISFLSKAWGGRTSDKHIVENSGFLDHIIPGDVVLADRGFLIKDSLDSIGASLNIPAFTKGVNQLHPMDIEETRKLANVRIHVERVIGGLKNKFKILIGTLPVEMLHCNNSGDSFIDEILTTCGALHNLCPAIT